MPAPITPFRGNKAALPSKPCAACGRPMGWRRRWARTWDAVKFCSDACRRARAGRGRSAPSRLAGGDQPGLDAAAVDGLDAAK